MSEFILGVDLDGVCGQHTEIFRHLVAHELGIDEESLPLQRSWDFREWNFTDGDFELSLIHILTLPTILLV